MPMTKIYLRAGSTPEHKRAISDAVHEALVAVLGIPEDDRFHIFHELADENLLSEPVMFGLERRRQVVALQLYFGPRPVEVLNELFTALVANLTGKTGLEKRDIFLNVIESPSPNWWADGRVLNPETGFDERIADDKVPS
jgi:phenylpyruvate tautomerase PptA (4-oxalocrotonate tautomerase family)